MYFNFWSNNYYILKGFLFIIVLFLIFFIILKILVKAHNKYIKVYNKTLIKKNVKYIIESNKTDEEKFYKIQKMLNLNSSYNIQKLTGVKNKEVLTLIQEKKFSILNNLIYNKILNNE